MSKGYIKKILLSLMMCLCLIGCNKSMQESIIDYNTDRETCFVILCTHVIDDGEFTFIHDTSTHNILIKYYESRVYSGGGSLSYYYNDKGEIMKYDEFQLVHKH